MKHGQTRMGWSGDPGTQRPSHSLQTQLNLGPRQSFPPKRPFQGGQPWDWRLVNLFSSLTGQKKNLTSKQGHLTLAGASSHVIVLRRAGWGSHTEWIPTGKMCDFPLGVHIAHGWEGEIPRGGVGRSSSWLPRGPSVKMFKIMRHLCTGASVTFLQGRE